MPRKLITLPRFVREHNKDTRLRNIRLPDSPPNFEVMITRWQMMLHLKTELSPINPKHDPIATDTSAQHQGATTRPLLAFCIGSVRLPPASAASGRACVETPCVNLGYTCSETKEYILYALVKQGIT